MFFNECRTKIKTYRLTTSVGERRSKKLLAPLEKIMFWMLKFDEKFYWCQLNEIIQIMSYLSFTLVDQQSSVADRIDSWSLIAQEIVQPDFKHHSSFSRQTQIRLSQDVMQSNALHVQRNDVAVDLTAAHLCQHLFIVCLHGQQIVFALNFGSIQFVHLQWIGQLGSQSCVHFEWRAGFEWHLWRLWDVLQWKESRASVANSDWDSNVYIWDAVFIDLYFQRDRLVANCTNVWKIFLWNEWKNVK